MKVRFMEFFDIGSHGRMPWIVLGLLLLSLVSMETASAQKPPDVLPSSQSGGSLGLPASGKPAASAKVATSSPTARLTALTTSRESENLVVSITASAPVEHREYVYDGPSRLVLDLWNVVSKVPFQRLDINTGSVKKVRVGEYLKGERKTTRLVFDLEAGARKYEIKTDGSVIRLVFPPSQGSTEIKAAPKTEAPKPSVPKTSTPKPSAPKAAVPKTPAPEQTVTAKPSVPKTSTPKPSASEAAVSKTPAP